MTVKELYRIFDFPVEIQLIKNGEQIDCVINYEDNEVKFVSDYHVQIQEPIAYNEIEMPFGKLILEVQI
jgi:hypothetical protein